MKVTTDAELVFFVNSSGHCTFDCTYCIITPIAKKQPSINYDDIRFLLESIGNRKAFLAFSGVGDFFAGYAKNDRFLERILEHDIEIALDVNGAIIQELPELSSDRLAKIRYINLTMHYHELKVRKSFASWSRNARTLIGLRRDEIHPDYIITSAYRDEWDEALSFYREHVFSATAKRLLLVRDINLPLSDDDEAHLQDLAKRYADILQGLHQEDYEAVFADRAEVVCPAGQSYFRVWNDGRVQGCPNLPGVDSISDNGNLKERRLRLNDAPFTCSMAKFCDCNIIEELGRMQTPDASRSEIAG